MAFNFGAEEQVPLPPPPASMKAEPGGYAVGQENGYAGVRVRIKSLKNVPKDVPKEEGTPEVLPDKRLNNPAPVAPVSVKQETAKVIELKLFDLPPVEAIKEERTVPGETVENESTEDETGFMEDTIPEVDNLPIAADDNIQAPEEVSVDDNAPVATEDTVPALVEGEGTTPMEERAMEINAPAIEVTVPALEASVPAAIADNTPDAPPAAVGRKIVPPVSDTHTQAARTPAIGANTDAAGFGPGNDTPGKPAKSKRGRKSLKQATAEADLIEVPGDDILFSKQYYTMRAVAEMFRVNQSLLRFWETEFDILQPRKNKKGDRYFRPVDIKNLHLIYHLLRQRKYTIEGAKNS